ncbi:MAG: bifunctional riboflavin kinase/FAD synthetase [Clostridia bacterium]|nr:bifunctional riboflavin kinase/FAD synthetase [Clostridia bacterium]
MIVFTEPFVQITGKTAVALGFFDGVHVGHKAVIENAVKYSRENNIPAVVWTFLNSPKKASLSITDNDERKALFEALGVDILIAFPFSEDVKGLTKDKFVNTVLKENLNAQKVFCGFNYSFGAGGKGTPEELKQLCEKQDISVEISKEISVDGETVSSTRIREYIENGFPEKASRLLGRPYSISGTVTTGKKLGRTLGFPTANVHIPENKVFPKDGVYLTVTSFEGKSLYGITNIGTNPTVDEKIRRAENFIFDFGEDIYGKEIEIEFLRFIRGERKFDSVELLAAQVKKDIETAKSYIE